MWDVNQNHYSNKNLQNHIKNHMLILFEITYSCKEKQKLLYRIEDWYSYSLGHCKFRQFIPILILRLYMSGSRTFKAALNIVKSISDTFVSYQIDLLIVYGTKIRIKEEKFYSPILSAFTRAKWSSLRARASRRRTLSRYSIEIVRCPNDQMLPGL